MKAYQLNAQALIGGVLAEDHDQQMVQLNLQKDNEVPPYSADAIITLIVLSGSIYLQTDSGQIDLPTLSVARLEPQETHAIKALENQTLVLVIKQLSYEAAISKKLRFGQCCF